MRSQEFIIELKTQGEITELEQQLDRMFASLGLDVEFSRHFVERLLGRERKITADEIQSAFEKLKRKYKSKLLKAKKTDAGPGALQDFDSDLNILFAIDPKKDEHGKQDLINITAKHKDPDQFHTSTPSGNATPYQVGSRK